MSVWKLQTVGELPKSLHKPVLIEGLPGIGNVGKVAADFLIEELNAKKMYAFVSNTFPHSVFVNENNLVELPSIEMYYKKFDGSKPDLLILVGDVQPIDEVSCYDFCELVLDVVAQFGGTDVITLGGIGLQMIPKKPKVYCTGNSRDAVTRWTKGTTALSKLYGIVGPIVGVSGVLLGLAARRRIPAITYLAETFGHPMYLGVKGSCEVLSVMKKKLELDIDVTKMEKDIEEMEKEVLKKTKEISDVSRNSAVRKLRGRLGKETSYIG
ncbi:MAG: PAC2 family protein [Nanoarchaeota archaeon]